MHISGTQEYFWVAAHDYFLGSTISPGHWGRIIQSCGVGLPRVSARDGERLSLALREYVFEATRVQLNSRLPSRLDCLFLCPGQRTARALVARDQPARNHQFIYRVEPLSSEGAFRASMDLAAIDAGDTVATLAEKARLYWSGYETEAMEVLVTSPIRIREKLASDRGGLADAAQLNPPHRGAWARAAPSRNTQDTAPVPIARPAARRPD